MEPRIIDGEQVFIVGAVSVGKAVTDIDIFGLWKKYLDSYDAIRHKVPGTIYEIHVWDDDAEPEGHRHYCMTGVEVSRFEDIPLKLFAKILPRCTYAAFTHCLKDGGYGQAYRRINEWLGDSEHVAVLGFDVQCCDDVQFQGSHNPESVIEIRVPVALK